MAMENQLQCARKSLLLEHGSDLSANIARPSDIEFLLTYEEIFIAKIKDLSPLSLSILCSSTSYLDQLPLLDLFNRFISSALQPDPLISPRGSAQELPPSASGKSHSSSMPIQNCPSWIGIDDGLHHTAWMKSCILDIFSAFTGFFRFFLTFRNIILTLLFASLVDFAPSTYVIS
ncbi:hypothetical protein QR680_000429 [Steinernema hermaphroditum]|uniref:Uncharacterized protein n=1 Tax=Steinernema hermaphroditum TaxID=289476 RepID=A0AA39GUK4_9BILA|nr:hypothetical protein QR680_000429 [Steinernema hermaphroditum]